MTVLAPPPLAQQSGRGRPTRLASPLAVGAAAALGTVALHLRDPHQSGAWGYCPTALIGLDCPFCGSLRAVNDLTHLDLSGAASSNLLFVLAAPLIVALWGRRLAVLWRAGPVPAPPAVPRWMWVTLGVVVATFTLARNLPVGAWLAS